MLPVIVIVGRPNVGKSTLFNALTCSKDALVADFPGVTRDRQYGEGKLGDKPYILVDTGGLAELDDPEIAIQTDQQVMQAIDEADSLIFMVDARVGLTAADQAIAKLLRRQVKKPIQLVVNKADGEELAVACSDFYGLGLGEPYAISATRGRNVASLMQKLLMPFPAVEDDALVSDEAGIKIAVVGRPNVGKSTLINRLLGSERVMVLDHPGTTRDSIAIPYERRGQRYTLIDTAGIRRRSRITEAIEKFSIIKTLQAIKTAHVVVMVLDASAELAEQDVRLIGMVLESGKGLVLAFNKWDGLGEHERQQFKAAVERRLPFVTFARRYCISALHGTGVGKLYHAVNEAYESASQEVSTNRLTQILQQAVRAHAPPLVRGRRIRLRYAHLGGHHPLRIIIHGKQIEHVTEAYQRYLMNYFRRALHLVGVPILLHLKRDENPYI